MKNPESESVEPLEKIVVELERRDANHMLDFLQRLNASYDTVQDNAFFLTRDAQAKYLNAVQGYHERYQRILKGFVDALK